MNQHALSLDGAGDLIRYVRRDETGLSTFEVAVRGAHCANCLAKIERGVGAIPGVVKARLNLSTGEPPSPGAVRPWRLPT